MPNNYTCILVDDEQDAIDLLSDKLEHLYKNIRITGAFLTWENALNALRVEKCDLLLMDISMPGKNSIDLLKLLPNLDSEIIFVTAYDNYALDAFAFSTSGYLLKPVNDTDLSFAINKAIERIQNKKLAKQVKPSSTQLNDKIGIPNNHGIDYVSINDIYYLESANKCTKVVTAKSEFISSINIGNFKFLVDNHFFFQVHRAYIINLNCITRYESSGMAIMANKKEIPVSRNVKNEFLKIFNNYH
jgi:two-component system LytT family response regulator